MFEITGFYFVGKYVIYSSVINDKVIGVNRFCSIHERTGLTDDQAMNRFISKHTQEVKSLIIQKIKDENDKSKANHSGRILQQAEGR